MTKSAKHKALRRKDKAKIKLASGIKKLAKSQNIVEPTLRTKKILIKGQLQNPVEGELIQSSRNRTLQDIFNSLSHHNSNTRKDAILGLREVISDIPEALPSNLEKMLEKIGILSSDIENSVRKENLVLAELIFSKLTRDEVKPFWNLLLTYIKCTLTNLNPNIRQNSLPLITILISYFPELVSSSLHILLPEILGLISTISKPQEPSAKSSVKTGSSQKNKPKSQLKLEITNKQESSKGRIKVLQVVSNCLKLVPKHEQFVSSSSQKNISKFGQHFKFEDLNFSIGIHYPFGYEEMKEDAFMYGFHEIIQHKTTSLGLNSFSMKEPSSNTELAQFWLQFMESCLPVLIQTWLEIRPIPSVNQLRTIKNLQNNEIEGLECIATLMLNLILIGNKATVFLLNEPISHLETSEENSLRTIRRKYGTELQKHFFEWLPFSVMSEINQKLIVSINLKLFHCAAHLKLIDLQIMEKLKGYIHALMKKSALDANQITIILDMLLLIRISKWEELLNKVLLYAIQSKFLECVTDFFLQILENNNCSSLQRNFSTSSNKNFNFEVINWNTIIPLLLENTTTLCSKHFSILTNLALKKLVGPETLDLLNAEKIKEFVMNGDEDENDNRWTELIRVLYYSNQSYQFTTLDSIGVPIPPKIQEIINYLH